MLSFSFTIIECSLAISFRVDYAAHLYNLLSIGRIACYKLSSGLRSIPLPLERGEREGITYTELTYIYQPTHALYTLQYCKQEVQFILHLVTIYYFFNLLLHLGFSLFLTINIFNLEKVFRLFGQKIALKKQKHRF